MKKQRLFSNNTHTTTYTDLRYEDYSRYTSLEIMDLMQSKGDFEYEGCRFVHRDSVLGAVVEYLFENESICYFTPEFLSDQTSVPQRFFEVLQDNEEYDVISEYMQGFSPEVQYGIAKEAIDYDGAGHFLSQYDGEELEIGKFMMYRTE